ncbi:MDIS1-interacting receptor like kinase 2-like [Typha latifolia]|uniref:MDIS1-interacting receptor like kinase 2-like n=1 Tax=Typha latifolia TaxID=4733 RepID=UPI003C2B3E5A
MENPNLFSIWNFDGKNVLQEIIDATKDFDDIYCLGIGSSGSVYKGELSTGQVVAVKRFHQAECGELLNDKSFRNEMLVLTKIKHRNIVRLLGFCFHAKNMLLIYDYIQKGSLFKMLCDFGTAKLLRAGKSNWTDAVGTYGYAAPGVLLSPNLLGSQ